MYSNVAYLNNSFSTVVDHSQPLLVSCCGHYRFWGQEHFHTQRRDGRQDYQLLYVASGTAKFFIHGKWILVAEGNMVLYCPGQVQDYIYYGQDRPEVFWVHFTGSCVENILADYGLTEQILPVDRAEPCRQSFLQMIRELQACRIHYAQQLTMCLYQLFIQLCRSKESQKERFNSQIDADMEESMQFFREHYMEPICIDQYAHSLGMSVSWFLRCFKQSAKQSPMQYITALRINNAANLLENTHSNISEIAATVGYENPLYFSRIFRKIKGLSPSLYRKKRQEESE